MTMSGRSAGESTVPLCGVIVDLPVNRGLYCLNPHHALVIFTQPISAFFRQCSGAFDWHLLSCARTSMTPVVATLHTSPHFSEQSTSASCDSVCFSQRFWYCLTNLFVMFLILASDQSVFLRPVHTKDNDYNDNDKDMVFKIVLNLK